MVEHNTLTAGLLHENKGVEDAATGTVATAADGVTVWKKLTAGNLAGSANPFGSQFLHVQEVKPSGDNGGTFSAGAWRTRVIDTVQINQISGASLASNQITLPAGDYIAMCSAPCMRVSQARLRLQNMTNDQTLILGQSVRTDTDQNATILNTVNGRFTLTSSKKVALQHRCNSSFAATGLGFPANFAGVAEVYAEVMLWKVG